MPSTWVVEAWQQHCCVLARRFPTTSCGLARWGWGKGFIGGPSHWVAPKNWDCLQVWPFAWRLFVPKALWSRGWSFQLLDGENVCACVNHRNPESDRIWLVSNTCLFHLISILFGMMITLIYSWDGLKPATIDIWLIRYQMSLKKIRHAESQIHWRRHHPDWMDILHSHWGCCTSLLSPFLPMFLHGSHNFSIALRLGGMRADVPVVPSFELYQRTNSVLKIWHVKMHRKV